MHDCGVAVFLSIQNDLMKTEERYFNCKKEGNHTLDENVTNKNAPTTAMEIPQSQKLIV
jgi:hypothetical protein